MGVGITGHIPNNLFFGINADQLPAYPAGNGIPNPIQANFIFAGNCRGSNEITPRVVLSHSSNI